jgi:hypothetical protein
MKSLYTFLIAMLALFVSAAVAVADPGATWEKKIAGAGRFKVLSQFGNAAVLDKETGRVWEKSPITGTGTWFNALDHCYKRVVGRSKGWRLPTIEELASLVEPGNPPGGPDLPLGHPFDNVQSSLYWSATTDAGNTSNAWFVDFGDGDVDTLDKFNLLFVWCVRGGQGIDGVQ